MISAMMVAMSALERAPNARRKSAKMDSMVAVVVPKCGLDTASVASSLRLASIIERT